MLDRFTLIQAVTIGALWTSSARAQPATGRDSVDPAIDTWVRGQPHRRDADGFKLGMGDPQRIGSPTVTKEIDGGCTNAQKYRIELASENIALFDPNAGLLWPGALIQGRSVHSGTLAAIDIEPQRRAPLNLTIDNVAPTTAPGERPPSPTKIVVDPHYGSVEAARLELILRGFVPNPSLEFDDKVAHSAEQAAVSLGFSATYLSASLKATLSSSIREHRSTIVVSLWQRYYTISTPGPSSPRAVFTGSVSVDDLRPYSNQTDNPVGFLRSVTYGRRALLIVSSNERREALNAAVRAAAEFAANRANARVSSSNQRIFNNSSVRLVLLGGRGDDVRVIAAANKVEAFKQAMATPLDERSIAQAVPISYRVDYLSDNTPMRIASASEYEVVDRGRSGLENIRVSFLTTRNDKDAITALSVTLRGNQDGRVYAQSTVTRGFRKQSTDVVTLQGRVPSAVAKDSTLVVHITPSREDTWTFSVVVKGDGYEHHATRGYRLTERDRSVEIPLTPIPDECRY